MAEAPAPDVAPLPVLPLGYQSPADDAAATLRTVSRGVTVLVVVGAMVVVVRFVLHLACYTWQLSTVFPVNRRAIDGWPLAFAVPGAVVGLGLLAGGVDSLRFREAGRRTVTAWVAVNAVLTPITDAVVAVYYHLARHHLRYGLAYAVDMAGAYAIGGLYGVAVSILAWRFYQHPVIRGQFTVAGT